MIKEAIEKIVSLATPQTYKIGEDTYTINPNMKRVIPYIDRPPVTELTSLDGIVKAIHAEIGRVCAPVFVNVAEYDFVKVFTTYRKDNLQRDLLYTAKADRLDSLSEWMPFDDAMIALRSRFVETKDTTYILELLSTITDEGSVQTTDNGLTQTVNVKQGVSLQAKEKVRPRVSLKPFRTFMEVDQPESEFLLRVRRGDPEKGKEAMIGLFEADGGAWKLQAKHNIAEHFREQLAELIEQGLVIVSE